MYIRVKESRLVFQHKEEQSKDIYLESIQNVHLHFATFACLFSCT